MGLKVPLGFQCQRGSQGVLWTPLQITHVYVYERVHAMILHTGVHPHGIQYVRVRVCVFVQARIFTYLCVQSCASSYVCVPTRLPTRIQSHRYMSMSVPRFIHICICMVMHIRTLIHVYIHVGSVESTPRLVVIVLVIVPLRIEVASSRG